MKHVLGFALLALAAPAAFAWDGCEHRAPRNLDLAAEGITTLDLRARAGALSVRGGGSAVKIRGEACASDAAILPQIVLRHERHGDTLRVWVEIPGDDEAGGGWGGWGDDEYRALSLDVTVPARLDVVVHDTSGEAEVRDVASLVIGDSSGELEIEAIAGDVQVTDSSGEIDVRDVGGNLSIPADSSGEITARGVRGNVDIAVDSSGSIVLEDVGGDATIGTDSSGDIEFARITGSARVDKDSSGDVEARDIGRDFVVRSDGSGDVRHHGVKGLVDVPDER